MHGMCWCVFAFINCFFQLVVYCISFAVRWGEGYLLTAWRDDFRHIIFG